MRPTRPGPACGGSADVPLGTTAFGSELSVSRRYDNQLGKPRLHGTEVEDLAWNDSVR